jgi:16S rRNA processing protein RimM
VSGPGGLTEVVVGRVGRAHGIRGEVSIEVRTDEPALRFTPGAVLRAASGKPRSLTVDAVRPHGDRLLITFAEVRDRTAAEAMRGAVLVVDVEPGTRPDDPDEFYDRQLIGLRVRTTAVWPAAESGDGAADAAADRAANKAADGPAGGGEVGPPVGTVVDLRHLPAQDLLEIRLDAPAVGPNSIPDSSGDTDAPTVLVPFVRDLVPVVDLDAGWLVVAAVPGLLDPEQPGAAPGSTPDQG